MTSPEQAALRQVAVTMLANRAGPGASAEAVAAAADRAYDHLASVLGAVIGDLGIRALIDRALHLTTPEYPWMALPRDSGDGNDTFAHIIDTLKQRDAAEAAEAAAAVFAALLALLATFIGEPLAERLMRQAWPDAPPKANIEET